MTTLSIELPTIPEPEETVSIIPENAKLLHTFIPTVEQVEKNIPIFHLYENDGQKMIVTMTYDNGYKPQESFILEDTMGTNPDVILLGLNDNQPIKAKVDTGAGSCSLNAKNIKSDDHSVSFDFNNRHYKMGLYAKHDIQTADGGSEIRPVIKLSVRINNESVPDVSVNLNDRGQLDDFLIGMNLIEKLNVKIDPTLKEYVDQAVELLGKNHEIIGD